MNATRLRDELLNAGYILLCSTVGFAAFFGLWQLGIRGEITASLCNLVALVGGIVVSRRRRQALVQNIRMANEHISRFDRMRRERRSPIVRPPVSRLDRFAQLLWSVNTYERVFKPARADIIREWQQAEVAKDLRRAQLIKYVIGPALMLQHMVTQLPFSLIKKLWTAAK